MRNRRSLRRFLQRGADAPSDIWYFQRRASSQQDIKTVGQGTSDWNHGILRSDLCICHGASIGLECQPFSVRQVTLDSTCDNVHYKIQELLARLHAEIRVPPQDCCVRCKCPHHPRYPSHLPSTFALLFVTIDSQIPSELLLRSRLNDFPLH